MAAPAVCLAILLVVSSAEEEVSLLQRASPGHSAEGSEGEVSIGEGKGTQQEQQLWWQLQHQHPQQRRQEESHNTTRLDGVLLLGQNITHSRAHKEAIDTNVREDERDKNRLDNGIPYIGIFGAFGWFLAAVLICQVTAPQTSLEGKATFASLWLSARHTGFWACIIAQASWVYYLLLFNTTSEPNFITYFWPLSPDLAWLVPLDVCAEVVRRVVTYNGKRLLFCSCFGMSHEDYVYAKGARSKWTEVDVEHYSETYGAHNIKMMDAINRRLGHVIVNVWRIILLGWCARSVSSRVQLLIVSALISSSWRFALEESESNLASFMFAGARISDGRFGRFNQVIVSFFSSAGKILAILIFLTGRDVDNNAEIGRLISLSITPLLWGDTFGELVGSFWGRLRFPVIGLGQGPKSKTVEGTIAVWISSTIGLMIMIAIRPLPASLAHWKPLHLSLIVAFAATAGEGLAPCGTDNYSVVVSSAAMLSLLRA